MNSCSFDIHYPLHVIATASPVSNLTIVEDLAKLDSMAQSLSMDKQYINEMTLKSLQRLYAKPFNGTIQDMAAALEKLAVWYSEVVSAKTRDEND